MTAAAVRAAAETGDGWRRQTFASLDEHYAALKQVRPDLAWTSRQLVRGGLEGTVISCSTPRHAVTCTSARGSFEMRGPASTTNLVLSLSLLFPKTGLQWMQPVEAGMVGVYQPGTEVDAINLDSVSFVVIDISHEELEREAELEGLVIPASRIMSSGIVPGRVSAGRLAGIAPHVGVRHRGGRVNLPPGYHLDSMLVSATVEHMASGHQSAGLSPGGYFRVVERARAFIEEHLDNPITIDDLVAAANTSRRTLHRAFIEVLDETPQAYVLKLRLNRIRRDLASPEEAERTVTTVSHRWGISELGKLAARYRAQFGELPSETLARRIAVAPPAAAQAQTA